MGQTPDGPMHRRFAYGYSGMSYEQALYTHTKLMAGYYGVHDPKERADRAAVLKEIMLEQLQ